MQELILNNQKLSHNGKDKLKAEIKMELREDFGSYIKMDGNYNELVGLIATLMSVHHEFNSLVKDAMKVYIIQSPSNVSPFQA